MRVKLRSISTVTWLLTLSVVSLAAAPVAAQAPANPRAYWKLDETGSQTTAVDSTGNGFDLQLTGNATWLSGKHNGGLGLDGIGDYASRSGATGLQTGAFAISAWVNYTTTSSRGGEVASLGDNFGLRIQPTGLVKVFFHDGPSSWQQAVSSVTTNNGAWHHVLGQYDPAAPSPQLRVYVDGVLRGSAAVSTPISYTLGTDFVLGRHGGGSTLYDFNGRLDQVRIYDRALSDAEVAALSAEAPKILTWNLRKGRATDNGDSIAAGTVSAFAKYSGADILLLSAVETSLEAAAIKDQLNVGGGTWDVYYMKAADPNNREGQAIISRFTMPSLAGDREFLEVDCAAEGDTENQVIVKAVVVINSVRFSFFAIDQQHGSRPLVRTCQANAFRNWASARPEPRIVGGDFNASSGAGLDEWLTPPAPAVGYTDGWSATGALRFGYPDEGSSTGNTNGRTLTGRIDHIITSNGASGFTVVAAQVWDTRFVYPGTTCNNVASGSFLGVACTGDCSSCTYVDDKGVRPTDHIPLTVTIVQ